MMALARRVNLPWTTLATSSTGSEEFLPATGWMSTDGIANGRGWLELRGLAGSLQVAVAIQTANDVLSPDTHVRLQALVTANGVSNPDASAVAIPTSGKKFIRIGLAVKSGSGTVMGRVGGVVELFD